MRTRVEKRMTRGYTVQLAYTWAKFMDATGYLNSGDAMPERAISGQDYPHRLAVSWIYEFSSGKGRHWLAGTGGVIDRLVSGWRMRGIYTARSGQALAFGNYIVTGDPRSAVPPASERKVERWCNTNSVFERDPLAFGVHEAEVVLGGSVPLPGGFAVPADGFGVSLRHFLAFL